VTVVGVNVAVPVPKESSAASSTADQAISTTTSSKGGPTTVLDTLAAAQPTRESSSSTGYSPTNPTSQVDVASPNHISFQAATTSEETWSTSVIAPQQAVEVDITATSVAATDATADATTVAATTVDAALTATEEKTDAATATGADAGPTADASVASPDTGVSQPTTVSATPTLATGNSLPANAPAGSSTSGSDGNSIASGVDRVRFVQRVARAFQTVGTSGGSVRLRLSPPELGSVRLEVSVKNGVLTAHAQTETTQARDALVDNLPALRARLAEQNIQVDQFEVDLFDTSGGGTSNQSQGGGDSSPGFTPTAARLASRSTGPVTAAAAQTLGATVTGVVNGGLNVVI
jgi:flagellar hook-length control protein FliK